MKCNEILPTETTTPEQNKQNKQNKQNVKHKLTQQNNPKQQHPQQNTQTVTQKQTQHEHKHRNQKETDDRVKDVETVSSESDSNEGLLFIPDAESENNNAVEKPLAGEVVEPEELQFEFDHFEADASEEETTGTGEVIESNEEPEPLTEGVEDENSDENEDEPTDVAADDNPSADSEDSEEEQRRRRPQRRRLKPIILSYDQIGEPSYSYHRDR